MFRSSFRDRWKIEGSCPVIFSLLIFCKDCEDVGSIRHCGKVRLSNYLSIFIDIYVNSNFLERTSEGK